ncbi:MAG: AAA family ATPase [Candidatus Competibacteraceae bacterium]|nr:AAA family ATPase [Candidatus Competibacteraceae bacterium]
MYAEYFGLREPPFAITPDPGYVYLSPHHREALAHLLYGTDENGGFVQLTGEVGTGKTTLVRSLLEQGLEQVDIALCLNPRLTVEELLATVCDELNVSYPREHPTLKGLVDALNEHLLRVHATGRRTVLIIDEAQNLSREVLEQVRLLTNLETTKHKLLRIILVGQPELRALLARPDLRQLAQRITARYHLPSLDAEDTAAYIRHRLRVAGGRDDLFSRRALRAVYRRSGGVPRLINIICDRALLGAYGQNARRVSAGVVQQAAREALQDRSFGLEKRFVHIRPALAIALAGLLMIGIALRLPDTVTLPLALPADDPTAGKTAAPAAAPAFVAAPALAPASRKADQAAAPASVPASRKADQAAASASEIRSPPPVAARVDPATALANAPAIAPTSTAGTTAPASPTTFSAPAVTVTETAPAPASVAASSPAASSAASAPPSSAPSGVSERPATPMPATSSATTADLISLLSPTSNEGKPPSSSVGGGQLNLSALLRDAHIEKANEGLLALWGIAPFQGRAAAFCEQVKTRGLRCLSGQGDWEALRHFNRPAVLPLNRAGGGAAPVLLRSLADNRATLEVGGQLVTVPLEQIKPLWTGQYVLLWKLQTDQPIIGPGNNGEAVRWLRRRLAMAAGQPIPEAPSERFDAELGKQVRAFQQARGLLADGMAGEQTLVLLNNLAPLPGTPLLSQSLREP